jgi:plastocyanin
MRRGAVTVIVLTALAAAVMPALAADDATITARDNFFDPNPVTIRAGETVTFANGGSAGHNFNFGNGEAYPSSPAPPGPAWSNLRKTFSQPGTYSFVCDAHADMTGTVIVEAATPTPTPTATPTPTPGPPAEGGAQLEVRTLRLTASTFCTKRGPKCRRPGVKVRIDLSRPADVSGALSRRPPGGTRARRFGRVDFGTVAAGMRTLKFTKNAAGKRLTAGRYTLKLTIGTRAPQTLRFKVR